MAYHHDLGKSLARFIARMRDRVTDGIYVARIACYLEGYSKSDTEPRTDAPVLEDIGVGSAVALMEPLTRSILILVVGHRMSVAEVSRRFGMSEEQVCRQFRLAIELVVSERRDAKDI